MGGKTCPPLLCQKVDAMNNDKICTGGRSYWMEIGETDTEAYLLTVHFGPFANRKEAEAFGNLLDQEQVFGGKVLIQ